MTAIVFFPAPSHFVKQMPQDPELPNQREYEIRTRFCWWLQISLAP